MKHWAGKGVRLLVTAAAAAVLAVASPARAASPKVPEPTPDQAKFFEQKVRPLLVENCYSCHAEKKQKGRLRLDSLEAALKGGDTGPAVVPGDVAKSLLVKAISHADEDLQMPPDEKLADEQIKVLTDWVAMGAPWPKTPGGAVTATPGGGKKRVIKDEDRQFWSFQPVKDFPVPQVQDNGWAKNDIDRFVFAKLKAEGLAPAAEADKVALIRRATFDLHGLPPTPEEVAAFVADASTDAYERLVERLLASPRYGERYARHWQDLVRYAESDGFNQDAYRPTAYLYRDWLIASLNADKPYDQFVREQLAGDEIAPGDPSARVATGFLRHSIYEYNQKNAENQWSEYLNDLTDVTADALLGLSMGCARCHDHKFDPILQADYYKLQAFFAPVLPRNDLPKADAAKMAEYKAALAAWEAKTATIRAAIDQIEGQAKRNAEARMVERFPPPVQAMIAKPPAERSAYERQIAYLVYRQVADEQAKTDDKIKGPEKDKLIALRKELSAFDDAKPKPPPKPLCVTDAGPAAPPTRIPGDAENREFQPGYPVVLDKLNLPTPPVTPTADSTGRRTALANWVTNPANPLTTRVITNRLWQWHFGQGLVRTSSDYGVLGERPSHPELLDHLTARFLANGWSMKSVQRLIMTSATYRQSAVRPVPEVAKLKDPENRWLWRQNGRRLDAEQIRDAMLAASGELELDQVGGPSAEYTATKRSVFTKVIRNNRDPLLNVFDLSESFGSTASRNATTTATQSLMMINGDWPLKRAAAFAERVAREAGSADLAAVVERAYQLAHGRSPRPEEREAALAYLSKTRAAAMVANAAQVHPAGNPAAARPVPGVMPELAGDVNDQPITQVMPQTGGQGVLMRNANPADLLKMPPSQSSLVGETFTVEAYVLLESLYDSASVRVIASQWNGDKATPGWSLGVTSERSAYQPRNLILQLVGDAKDPARKGGYEVIPSNLRLELHRVYYVGVAVDLKDTSEKGVTFWLKDVGDMDAPLRTAQVRHAVTGSIASDRALVIGGTDATTGRAHGWDGLIGEVRISNAALKPDQILWNEGDPKSAVVGYWRFEESPGLLKESAGRVPDLVRQASAGTTAAGGAKPQAAKSPTAKATPATPPRPAAKVDAALIDLCHVLLNSNEFLYVD